MTFDFGSGPNPYSRDPFPPFNPPFAYAAPPVSPRPTSVTALAVIGIIVGALFGLCDMFNAVTASIMLAIGHNPLMPSAPMLPHTQAVIGVVMSWILLGFYLSLLIASTIALGLKPAARRFLLKWSWAMLAYAVVHLVVMVALMPQSMALAQKMPNMMPLSSGFYIAVGCVTLILTMGLHCTLPILFLTLWNRPHVVAAFEKGPHAINPTSGPSGHGY